MLSAMLRSDTAIEVSIGIIDEFVTMRHFLVENAALLERLRGIEPGQAAFQRSAGEHFDQAFRLLGGDVKKPQRTFYTGVFNAQYPHLTVLCNRAFHDRFLILDGETV